MLNLPSGLWELCGRGEEGIKEPEDGEEPCEILPVNEIIAGDLQLGVPFQASVPLLSFQTPPLRKPTQSQALPGAAQDLAYRAYKIR